MKIASWNINGIAAHRRELIKFLTDGKPDVMCIQETRGKLYWPPPATTTTGFRRWNPIIRALSFCPDVSHYPSSWGLGSRSMTGKAGPSPQSIRIFMLLMCMFRTTRHNPPERRKYRLNWDMAFRTYISKLPKPVVVCGDFNVTHTDQDIYPSEARSSTVPPDMITEERKNFERLLEVGLKDVFRTFYPEKRDASTWWAPKNQT